MHLSPIMKPAPSLLNLGKPTRGQITMLVEILFNVSIKMTTTVVKVNKGRPFFFDSAFYLQVRINNALQNECERTSTRWISKREIALSSFRLKASAIFSTRGLQGDGLFTKNQSIIQASCAFTWKAQPVEIWMSWMDTPGHSSVNIRPFSLQTSNTHWHKRT